MEKGKSCPRRAEKAQDWSGSWRAPWRRQCLSGAGRNKKNLGGQSRQEAVCTVMGEFCAGELAWVSVLILGLPSTSCVTLDRVWRPLWLGLHPCKAGDNIPCIGVVLRMEPVNRTGQLAQWLDIISVQNIHCYFTSGLLFLLLQFSLLPN